MRSAGRRVLVFAAVLAIGLSWSRSASAQTDEEFFQTFPLNFSNPGARAQAMGGAFIAIADDASAAVTNPAGLANLTRQQAYFEYKGLNAPVAKLDNFNSLTTGIGPVSAPYQNIPGFINYARPINDKMTVAASYHQFLSYQNTYVLDARRIISTSGPIFPGVNANVSFKGIAVSGALGYSVSSKFKVGGAVSWNRLDASVDADRSFTPVVGPGGALVNKFTGTPFCGTNTDASGKVTTNPCTPTTLAAKIPSTAIHDTPSTFGATVGALVQPIESLTFGFVAAFEPHFTMKESVKAGESYPTPAASDTSWDVPFNMPSHFGGGVAWRINDRTLVTADGVYVQYSSLVQDPQPVVFRHTESYTSAGILCSKTNPGCLSVENATVSNGFDLHTGLEFEIVKAPTPIFLRYGFEKLAPHVVTAGSCPIPYGSNFTSTQVQQNLGLNCTLQSQLYAGVTQTVGLTGTNDNPDAINLAANEYGYTFGGGLVIGPRAQLDIAYVHTSYHRTDFIVSMAVRF